MLPIDSNLPVERNNCMGPHMAGASEISEKSKSIENKNKLKTIHTEFHKAVVVVFSMTIMY